YLRDHRFFAGDDFAPDALAHHFGRHLVPRVMFHAMPEYHAGFEVDRSVHRGGGTLGKRQFLLMFTWICPQCGREVPPAYNDCPDCAAKAKAASGPAEPPVEPPGPARLEP